MDETIYVILKLLFDFALEVWFSIVCKKRPVKFQQIRLYVVFYINLNEHRFLIIILEK